MAVTNPVAHFLNLDQPRQHGVRQHRRHRKPLRRRQAPEAFAVASWYYDAGGTACGFHAFYGVASPRVVSDRHVCGARVRFTYHGRSVTATIDDAGPFVAGRDFDVNQNVESVLGFDGVATVGYRYVS